MLTAEDLLAIRGIMQEEIKPVNDRLDRIETRLDAVETRLDAVETRLDAVEEDIALLKEDVSLLKEDVSQLKEDTMITRDVTNSIGEWIDFYFKEDRPYPVDKRDPIKFNG